MKYMLKEYVYFYRVLKLFHAGIPHIRSRLTLRLYEVSLRLKFGRDA